MAFIYTNKHCNFLSLAFFVLHWSILEDNFSQGVSVSYYQLLLSGLTIAVNIFFGDNQKHVDGKGSQSLKKEAKSKYHAGSELTAPAVVAAKWPSVTALISLTSIHSDHRQVAMDGGSVAYKNGTRSTRATDPPTNGLSFSPPGEDGTGVDLSEARLELGPEEDGSTDSLGRRNPAFSDMEEGLGGDRAGVGMVQPPAETAEQTNKAQFSTRL